MNSISNTQSNISLDGILSQLKEHFTVINPIYLDGYFIFEFGENTVCHFEIQETPDWKYGIWLLQEGGYKIFGDHKELIDKFKPTATYLSYENDLTDFVEIVKQIAANPKLYFVDALTDNALVAWEPYRYSSSNGYFGYQCIRDYNKETGLWNSFYRDESITQESYVNKKYDEWLEQKRQEKEDEEFDRQYAFDFFKSLPNKFEGLLGVEIEDRNKDGFVVSPRYGIWLITDEIEEKLDLLFDEVEVLVNEANYSNRKTYKHRFVLHTRGYFQKLENDNDLGTELHFNYRFLKEV